MLKLLGINFIVEQEEFQNQQREEQEGREYAELIGEEYKGSDALSKSTKVVTEKLAIRLEEIISMSQYYRDLESTFPGERETIEQAFSNLPNFSIKKVPLLSIEMTSGNVIIDVLGTIEYLLTQIENAETTN
jgi:hypothetical protein|tara:strand:- start:425 stop:820 length:396 start_codon:yes stop_codon:yes gene_type:complete